VSLTLRSLSIPHSSTQWFTGHSLGAAIGSLHYAKMLNDITFLNPRVEIRDGYMFGAPVLCDVRSKQGLSSISDSIDMCSLLTSSPVFESLCAHNPTKALWRITNAADIVATSIPSGGDDPDCLSSTTLPASCKIDLDFRQGSSDTSDRCTSRNRDSARALASPSDA
jgi:hypothetical protein